jgi:hypothetical protein
MNDMMKEKHTRELFGPIKMKEVLKAGWNLSSPGMD